MPRKGTIKSSIIKEIQRTIALVCLDIIYEKNSMSKKDQWSLVYEVYDYYHGNEYSEEGLFHQYRHQNS